MKFEFHISEFLEPIPGATPCGDSLRYTDTYDNIREARREDDDKLPQGVWKKEIKKADWKQVAILCQEALKNRSKDLQAAAWLTEAWLQQEGMGGLSRGLELILYLTQKFWAEIHPQIIKGEFARRCMPYEWINTRLSEEIQDVLISMPSDETTLSYRFLDYNEANRLEFQRQKSIQVVEEKLHSLTKISLSIEQTPSVFYRHLDKSCVRALALMAELEDELRRHLAENVPTFYRLREKTELIYHFARQVLNEKGEKKETKNMTKKTNSEGVSPSLKKPVLGPIENREQAYIILKEVAAYLERTEPHSPTPYLIHRAIAWGDMTLPEVITNALSTGQDLSFLLDILNVKKD